MSFCQTGGEKKPLFVCAPMVRYSKLPFRTLVRKYGCDLCYSPMIVASSFVQSAKARDVEFTTNEYDRPLIVQFAANNGVDFANAAELIANSADGIDLNCGCPQRWAMAEGYGSHLISRPDLLSDIVRQARNRIPDQNFCVSIKIRILEDIRATVSLCQQAQRTGISLIAVHARTPSERHQPVHAEAYGLIKSSVDLPVIANGDITDLNSALGLVNDSQVDGVMAARGLLHNPALFAGEDVTPLSCINDWIEIALSHGVTFSQFHHHLMFMIDRHLTRPEKQIFNRLQSVPAVLDYLDNWIR